MGQDHYRIEIPVFEQFNLRIDGDPAVKLTAEKKYTYATILIFGLHWAAATTSLALLADDTALTNGIQVFYNDKALLPETIKKNSDFGDITRHWRIDSDTKGAPAHHLTAAINFFEIMPNGLRLDSPSDKFQIEVADDIDGYGTEIHAFLCGYVLGKKRRKRF